MPTLDTFDPTTNLGILLQGPPGTGKTTLAAQFPNPHIIDCDNNLGGPARWLKINRPAQLPNVWYETVNITPDGKEVAPRDRYTRFKDLTKAAVAHGIAIGKPYTIIQDSATYISDYIQDDIRRQNGLKETEFRVQDWGSYLWAWKNLITQMRSIPNCTYILTAHERAEKDEVEGLIKYFVALPGQIRDVIGGLFSDIWHCEVEESQGKHKNVIRCMPNARLILKRSVPTMPANFTATWEEVSKHLGLITI